MERAGGSSACSPYGAGLVDVVVVYKVDR